MASTSVARLHRDLGESLTNMGYSGRVGTVPLSLAGNERVTAFLERVIAAVQPANYLTKEETQQYDEMKKSGKALEADELHQALATLSDTKPEEEDEDVKERRKLSLSKSIPPMKKYLQKITEVQKTLGEHYGTLVHKRDELEQTLEDCQKQYKNALESAREDDTKMNNDLDELCSIVRELTALHREAADHDTHPPPPPPPDSDSDSVMPEPATPPPFLSCVSQAPYHSAEDEYLSELTDYTKKQFFKGIAVSTHSPTGDDDEEVEEEEGEGEKGRGGGGEGGEGGGGGEGGESGEGEGGGGGGGGVWSDLDEEEEWEEFLKGVSPEAYQRHSKELERLKKIYPVSELQRVNALMEEGRVRGMCARTQELLDEMESGSQESQEEDQQHKPPGDRQLELMVAKIAQMKEEIDSFGESRLPTLLRDTTALQISKVILGDYDLKLARQAYFISKQDIVIEFLQSQRARHEVLAMLYELELHQHRDTHHLLSAVTAQLTEWKEGREKRCEEMRNPALLPVKQVKKAIDSRDQFALRLCDILGVKPSPVSQVQTYSDLTLAAEQLAKRLSRQKAARATHLTEHQRSIAEMESMKRKIERELFGAAGMYAGKLQVPVKEYEKVCSKLDANLDSLEEGIKSLLKEHNKKKKILAANPLLVTERNLFVYFFTDPPRLAEAMAELRKKVDALALAASAGH